MKVTAIAPSNIALIKYMGKVDHVGNRPTNSSLSLTLNHLKTEVRLSQYEGDCDIWKPLVGDGLLPIELSEKSQQRFLKHLDFLKEHFQIRESFLVESANAFPSDCGLASSASSFAALTKACCQLFSRIKNQPEMSLIEMAQLSRKGSGSSCRSLVGPWGLWDQNGEVKAIEFPYSKLRHQVVVVEDGQKAVSSSEAHRRVTTSDLFIGRPERANQRLDSLMRALQNQDWKAAYEISWTEFWDMHALFETSKPHFGYMTSGTLDVLTQVRRVWECHSDGPIVTMDAGANIHFIYREDQEFLAKDLADILKKKYLLYTEFGIIRSDLPK